MRRSIGASERPAYRSRCAVLAPAHRLEQDAQVDVGRDPEESIVRTLLCIDVIWTESPLEAEAERDRGALIAELEAEGTAGDEHPDRGALVAMKQAAGAAEQEADVHFWRTEWRAHARSHGEPQPVVAIYRPVVLERADETTGTLGRGKRALQAETDLGKDGEIREGTPERLERLEKYANDVANDREICYNVNEDKLYRNMQAMASAMELDIEEEE